MLGPASKVTKKEKQSSLVVYVQYSDSTLPYNVPRPELLVFSRAEKRT